MIDQEQVLEILHAIGEKITEEKLYLTELDNVIGDGDHGINLARGFAEVEKKRPMMEGKDIGTMLKTVGMALVSTVGGASGPLYGTAFMQAGKALAGKTELDAQDLLTILDAFVAGVQLRGKSVAGEKTMLDVFQFCNRSLFAFVYGLPRLVISGGNFLNTVLTEVMVINDMILFGT